MATGGLKKFFGWLGSVVAKSILPKYREALKEMSRLERELAVLEVQAVSYRALRSLKLAEVLAKIQANRERYDELRKMFNGGSESLRKQGNPR